jgi:phenylalanyl-tRNA synthetase beta subunit
MRDLPPYRPVSTMPTARRDLSLAVPDTLDAELLGDRVRTILGTKARAVEEVIVLSETAYIDLSEPVRARLGISPEHKNVLLRLILRDLDRTLSSAQATDYGTWCTRAYTSARPTSGLLTLGSLRLRLSPRQRHHREPGRRTSRVGVRQPARP